MGLLGSRTPDWRALAKVLEPDTVWVVPGSSKLSGQYIGRDEIFGFWKRVAEQTAGGLAPSRTCWRTVNVPSP